MTITLAESALFAKEIYNSGAVSQTLAEQGWEKLIDSTEVNLSLIY